MARWQENAAYGGVESFQDYIKGQLKAEYAFHKMGTLGMSYGMGPRKFQQAAYDAGYVISLQQARDFFNTYWGLFPGIRAFSQRCEATYRDKGYLVNDFGYRLVPAEGYKAMNYFIQSTVSGLMHVLAMQFFERAPYATFLLVIHDELLYSVPTERLEEARQAMVAAEEALNGMLAWRVRVRVGFKAGENMYTAK